MPTRHSYFHRGGDVSLLGQTIPERFSEIARRYPDNEAVVSMPQNLRLTYAELAKQADRVAKGLLATGFGKGDRIGLWSTNNLQWILLQLAMARIGALLVNINPAYRLRELEYALKKSAVQGLFLIPSFKTSNYLDMARLLWEEQLALDTIGMPRTLPELRRLIVYDPLQPMRTGQTVSDLMVWNDLLAAGETISQQQLDAVTATLDRDDPINIQYTSGTTGFPKAVTLTHHNILNNAYFSARSMHFGVGDRLCIGVPFYHCFGMVLANLLCFSVGATAVVACDYFEAESVLKAIETERCTALHGVPTMFIAVLEHPNFKHCRLDSLRTGIMAGAPCPPALLERVMHDMHCCEILIGYGETEASPLTHLTTRDDNPQRRTASVGRNLPHQEVKIVDIDNGQTVTYGITGEICFRGYHVMRGYFNDPEATAEAIDAQGWLHSGDLGSMDQDGYVQITGRLKEMVIRGGENIYPREIEDFIFTHPKVAQIAVFGIPDDYYGEELAAWIKLRSGETCSETDIREFCSGNIAHYKIPKFIRFVDSFPMTATGKLQKYRMREIMLEDVQGLREVAAHN
ncbi:MAG: fatty acid CoA ligase family protein [Gammaproteobacteria bacterium]